MSLAVLASPPKPLRLFVRVAIACLCASLVLATTRTSAHADEPVTQPAPARTPPEQALEHYNRGRAFYQQGRYQDAVSELEAALALDPESPNLVYNLARVYELLGQIDRSIAYYRRYYDMLPSSERDERERVASTIQRLEGARKQPLRPLETRTVPVVVPTERGVADGAFWTVATLSLAALVAGGVMGGLALREEHKTQDFVLGRDGDVAERNTLANRADRLALATDISLASGAVGSLTSVLLYALRTRPVVQPAVSFMQHGWVLGLRGDL